MPKLYIEEYRKSLAGSRILIACREGILREYIQNIIQDIKFIDRIGVRTVLLHNLPNRFANQKFFRLFESKLPNTLICRSPIESGEDFYEYALNLKQKFEKILFIERKYLTDERGRKLNSMTTHKALLMIREKKIFAYGDLINNTNFKGVIEKICKKIEREEIDRVHIVPAGKHCLKHELFSLEGTGTLIANNFNETMHFISSSEEVSIVMDILKPYIKRGLIKPRTLEHIERFRQNFLISEIDGIAVGCVEKIDLDESTTELGALAVATKYRNQQIGLFLIQSFEKIAKKSGYKRVVSLTRNPKLQKIYLSFGFERKTPQDLEARAKRSPGVPMFVLGL